MSSSTSPLVEHQSIEQRASSGRLMEAERTKQEEQ